MHRKRRGVRLAKHKKQRLARLVLTIIALYDRHCAPSGKGSSERDSITGADMSLDGVCIKFSGGVPSALQTPWGIISLGTGVPSLAAVKAFMARLELRRLKGAPQPRYAVVAIGRHKMPELVLPDKESVLPVRSVAELEWSRLRKAAHPFLV